MNLQELLQKKKEANQSPQDLATFLLALQTEIQKVLSEIQTKKDELIQLVVESESKIEQLQTTTTEKIDTKLDETTQSLDQFKQTIQNGKDYILTEDDKQVIASKIVVPIVEKIIEKTKVIEKQPIITNEIVKETIEVAKYEEPQKIADKLNTLTEKVEMSVIIGLKERFTNLINQIRTKNKETTKSGGGMGNWIHQRFSISSATTSITLSNNIAANGMAHIARYQGQVQDLDTQYSVSGKVITLLFTPDDGTVFSIAYVRK